MSQVNATSSSTVPYMITNRLSGTNIQGIRSGICPIIVQIKQVSSNFSEFPFRILNDKMTTIELLHVCLILPTAVGCGSVRQNPKRRHEFDKSLGKQICNRHLNILVLSSSCISNASCHYTIPMINILSAFVWIEWTFGTGMKIPMSQLINASMMINHLDGRWRGDVPYFMLSNCWEVELPNRCRSYHATTSNTWICGIAEH